MITEVNIEHSSNIKRVEYDDNEKTLLVGFANGTMYRYFDVPVEVFTDFIDSDKENAVLSPGKFFAVNVRNVFKYEKHTGELARTNETHEKVASHGCAFRGVMQERGVALDAAENANTPSVVVEGVRYLLGAAGSLVLGCPKCGEEHFRDADNYFSHPEWHTCMTCPYEQRMEPVKVDEIETRWRPIWDAWYAKKAAAMEGR